MDKDIPQPIGLNDEIITIKIQTLESQYPISIRRYNTIGELKEKLGELFNISFQNIRLIFQGKILNNSDKIKQYKIIDESVIHMVVRSTTISSQDELEPRSIPPTNTIYTNEQDNTNHMPYISLRRNNNHHRNRRHISHFDPSDCYECLYQTINTISNLHNCKNTFDYMQIVEKKTVHPFNFSKSKFEIGQWIDVKDTIDQWLEGQIVNMRTHNGTHQVLVHYNGWSSRWDEWIDTNSKRLSNFKTYTLQSPNSVFLSPNPTNNCDGNVEGQQHRPIDVFYYLEKANGIMNDISRTLEYMGKLKKKINNKDKDDISINDENEMLSGNTSTTGKQGVLSMNNFLPFSVYETELLFQTAQVIPFLDRCGRLLSDLSLQLSHLILNPNLYHSLLFGYNANEISDSMSCTSGYSMYTNESSSISGFTNNPRFIQDQNIAINLRSVRFNTFNISTNTINPNQIVRDYQNTNVNANTNTTINTNINTTNTQSQPQPQLNTPNTSNPPCNNNTNTNQTTTTNTNININTPTTTTFSAPRYVINSSNSELPFIQRLNFSNRQHSNYYNANNNSTQTNANNPYDKFPKINLQVPPLLSPAELSMVNNYNPLDEQNIFLFSRNVYFDQSVFPNQQPPHTNMNNTSPPRSTTSVPFQGSTTNEPGKEQSQQDVISDEEGKSEHVLPKKRHNTI